jgi:hypothetical protein
LLINPSILLAVLYSVEFWKFPLIPISWILENPMLRKLHPIDVWWRLVIYTQNNFLNVRYVFYWRFLWWKLDFWNFKYL